MCGRYTAKKNPVEIAEDYDADNRVAEDAYEPDYNVAPTKTVPIVRARKRTEENAEVSSEDLGRELVLMRWGLIPSWAKETKIGARMINARIESVASTSAFRTAYRRRRCIVPVDGWYEWRPNPDGNGKQPFYMTAPDGHSLSLAGLWEIWHDGDQRLTTFTILTMPSQGQLMQIHDRMPFILGRDDITTWLDVRAGDPAAVLSRPDLPRAEQLELRPVGREVGNVANNGAALIERQEPTATALF
ncbi:putative SOS response-associated peptidase YedK [Antricoccus suffuscus]|uniref:Abasic site processing protein n=1 Tax=Antricoccus suffuscus TaxID=1629062 RepID=A0A2T1A476_9ACTN|nr:SOS response-associated peptidase [Antricoccus suffuscus]PRZ43344.1 putative SOS response-associated peptidase YedK [Antricoccus suffuscus]